MARKYFSRSISFMDMLGWRFGFRDDGSFAHLLYPDSQRYTAPHLRIMYVDSEKGQKNREGESHCRSRLSCPGGDVLVLRTKLLIHNKSGVIQ